MSEEALCIECDKDKNLTICEICRDIVCQGCLFNHNQEEIKERQNTKTQDGSS